MEQQKTRTDYEDEEDDDDDFEFTGVSQEYETMDFFFFQSFFDNLSRNFVPPLLSNLTYFELNEIKGRLPMFDEELSIDYTLMGLRIANASIDPDTPFIKIGDGDFTFAFSNLDINLTTDYKFMSDPPILADIGEANLRFSNSSSHSDVTTYLHSESVTGSKFTVELSDMFIQS